MVERENDRVRLFPGMIRMFSGGVERGYFITKKQLKGRKVVKLSQ
jgi:hypothetical protein